jgi:non-specific serine/threonine protein kinase
VALSLNNLAWIAMERGQLARAEELFTAVVASHRARGDHRAAASSTSFLGVAVARRGDCERAIALHHEAIEMLEPVADHGFRMLCRVRLAAARHALGAPGDHATAVETEYLPAMRREEGRLFPIAYTLTELGAMQRDLGQLARARATLEEALAVLRQTGARLGTAAASLLLGTVHYRQGDRTRAAGLVARAIGDASEMGSIPTVIDCVEAVAAMELDAERAERSATLLSAAERARERFGAPRAPRYRPEYEHVRAALAAALGEERLMSAWVAGAAMAVDEAAALALTAIM